MSGEIVKRMEVIADLFYGISLKEEHKKTAEERIAIYEKHNGSASILASLMLIVPPDRIIHYYLEPNFVLALNIDDPILSELGYANVPIDRLPVKHGGVLRIRDI